MSYHEILWTKNRATTLKKWWPHWGTYVLATCLGLKRSQIKSKVDKLRLKMLPKSERLCIECKTGFQYSRGAGVRCRLCHLNRRKNNRRGICNGESARAHAGGAKERRSSLTYRIKEVLRTARYRGKKCTLTVEFLLGLWERQKGRCYYSNEPMVLSKYGAGRNPASPSLDRLDSTKSYTQGNVVWSSWICNAGKNTLSVVEYVKLCAKVARCHGDVLMEMVEGLE